MSIFLIETERMLKNFKLEVAEITSKSRFEQRFKDNILFPMKFYDQVVPMQNQKNNKYRLAGCTPVKTQKIKNTQSLEETQLELEFSSFGKSKTQIEDELVSSILEFNFKKEDSLIDVDENQRKRLKQKKNEPNEKLIQAELDDQSCASLKIQDNMDF